MWCLLCLPTKGRQSQLLKSKTWPFQAAASVPQLFLVTMLSLILISLAAPLYIFLPSSQLIRSGSPSLGFSFFFYFAKRSNFIGMYNKWVEKKNKCGRSGKTVCAVKGSLLKLLLYKMSFVRHAAVPGRVSIRVYVPFSALYTA